MGKLEDSLQQLVAQLQDQKEELEDSLQRVEAKLELCESLLAGEGDLADLLEIEAPKKKRGRPRKTATTTRKTPVKKRGRPKKKNPEDEKNAQLYEEAKGHLPDGSTGTTPEEQERALRRFNPIARPAFGGTGGVTVGSTKGKPEAKEPDPKGHSSISMEDDLPEED